MAHFGSLLTHKESSYTAESPEGICLYKLGRDTVMDHWDPWNLRNMELDSMMSPMEYQSHIDIDSYSSIELRVMEMFPKHLCDSANMFG